MFSRENDYPRDKRRREAENQFSTINIVIVVFTSSHSRDSWWLSLKAREILHKAFRERWSLMLSDDWSEDSSIMQLYIIYKLLFIRFW